jgi:cell division transport system permease protein
MIGALGRWLGRHAHAAVSSAGRLAGQPFGTILSVLVMGLTMALPLGLNLLVQNLRSATGNFSGAIGISVYLHQDVTDDKAEQLAANARARSGVARVQLISATAALEQFRKESGFGAALEALGSNPLPSVLNITPTPEGAAPAAVEGLRRYLAAWPEVESVQLDGEWVARFSAILEVLRRVLLLAAALFGAGVVAVVGNTIRLEILNRRPEIEVTKLVGGSNALVRRPFLYTGALYGLISALTAWLVIAIALQLLQPPVAQLALAYGSHFRLAGPTLREVGIVLGAGTFLGWLGAWLVASYHLAGIEPGSA